MEDPLGGGGGSDLWGGGGGGVRSDPWGGGGGGGISALSPFSMKHWYMFYFHFWGCLDLHPDQ